MLIRLMLMGCPLVRADYVGTCHSDRPPGCNSHRNDDVGWARTVGVSASPDLSPAGDAPICCRLMQVQNPPLESFIFDNCASSISCWSIPKPLHTFKMHLFISIQHNRAHKLMCILIWMSCSLLAALSSCSTPPHLPQLKHSFHVFARGHGGGGHSSSAFVSPWFENTEASRAFQKDVMFDYNSVAKLYLRALIILAAGARM